MAKLNRFIFLSAAVAVAAFSFLNSYNLAYAMTPAITSIVSTGSGDYVQINVTGDPNASVFLFAGSYSIFLGDLSSSGTNSFSVGSSQSENQTISIASNTTVYVKTGGINGTTSNQATWPYIQNSTTTSTLTLSQTALLLNAGQTSTITASANSLYLLSNSTPAIANINFNANQITIQALTYGSTVADICVVGSTSNCANITVTVQNSSSQQLTFSQNNFSIVSGQSIPVTVTGGSGIYTISNNSNTGAIQTSLNGSTVTLTATSNSGSDSITVCTTDLTDCGIINVSATSLNSTTVSFSQTSPVVPIGQSTTVTIYGGTGSNFYVSANSNPSIVQANINSNILTLIASAGAGTSNISVCAYAGSCASLVANVTSATSNGSISLSQNAISILAGQNTTITILGGSIPYSMSAPNAANIFNGVINGNTLTIYGVNPGSATANICASVGCTTLSVTINNINSSTNPITFSQNNILLNIGQQMTVYISGGISSGSYYISSNSASAVASEQINADAINITAMQSGSATVLICQSGGQCADLYITVSGTSSTNTTGQLVLNPSSLYLTVGQNTAVSITGSGSYYISSNSTPSIASVSLSGSSLSVYAIGLGSDNVSICESGGQCASLYITVSAQAGSGAQLVLSQTSLSLNVGQNSTVYITGDGSYYVSNNSTPGVASAQISGSSVIISAIIAGTDNVSICQSGGQCANLYVTVSGTTSTNVVTPTTTSAYVFSRYLGYGDKGDDVLKLQQILTQLGFLTATPTGHYGPATVAAIKLFQHAHGINQTGNVGPLTETALNQLSIPGSTAAAPTVNSSEISAIQQQIQQLLSQIAQMQGQ